MRSDIEKIYDSEKFHRLASRRRNVSFVMTLLILLVYFGFIFLVGFNKAFLGYKIADHLTVALPIGIGIILFACLLTGIYVYWSNHTYDAAVTELQNELKD